MKHVGLEYEEKQKPRENGCGPEFMCEYTWTLSALKNLLSQKDFGTKSHSDRLIEQVTTLGRKVGLSSRDLSDLRLFAKFHDLGKTFIPNKILLKKGPLTEEEWDIMKMHSEFGAGLANSFNELAHIADCILYHHERWDGLGYPKGLCGLKIPLFCRILSIADAWDAMVSDRPYRDAMSFADAASEIEVNAGTQLDPTLVEIWRHT